jgi:hypothetical protein
LFSEVSEPFETGITIDELDSGLNLMKNGDSATITVRQKLPLSCPHDVKGDKCFLKVEVTQVPEGKKLFFGQKH